MSVVEKNCTVLLHASSSGAYKEAEFIRQLETKDDAVKISTLKQIIENISNGESYPKLLMPVIKFCLNSENHEIKKLLLLFWEVVPKKDKDGRLLHEMILVCNAMKNNLIHPNEYVRGATLRFLCKMREPEILESLIPSITANLDHRNSYVRKYAVLTIMSIYAALPDLLPDAPELVEKFLFQEANPAAKKNAFMMLVQCDMERALNYLNSIAGQITTQSESFQLSALELVKRASRANPLAKSQYVATVHNLVTANSSAVQFEAANTLIALSSQPLAVKTAVQAYCRLLSSESDHNVKLVLLDRIVALRRKNERILQDMLLDIMRTLNSPNIDIRRKTLDLTLQLVSSRNVDGVVGVLRKELVKTETPEGKSDAYRKLLVDTLHQCAVRFPEVVETVLHVLMNYLGDEQATSAIDVIHFVREIVEEYPDLRDALLSKLSESFSEIRNSSVYRVALWILGEYSTDPVVLDQSLNTIRAAVGKLPLCTPARQQAQENAAADAEEKGAKESRPAAASGKASSTSVVLADGTYAQAATTYDDKPASSPEKRSTSGSLRSLLLDGDYFLASSLASAITKLSLRYCRMAGFGSPEANEELAKSMLLIVSLLRLGAAPEPAKPIDPDSDMKLQGCLAVLMDPQTYSGAFMSGMREAFVQLLAENRGRAKDGKAASDAMQQDVRQVDELISIRHLKGKGYQDGMDEGEDLMDMASALGGGAKQGHQSALGRTYQLTGLADPVYAEAELKVSDYDISMALLIVNQTPHILQNLTVEMHTSGDLKVVERPQTVNVPAHGSVTLRAGVKVTSTESGVIFGNVTYDSASGTQKTVVSLANIHMDIMDYITPATCTDAQYRCMWAEFEWENKVAVNTDITDLHGYVDHVLKITNMRCLTPKAGLAGQANFLSANLYARSLFGEDALLNVSVEKQKSGKVSGYIRIRSKTQGIALSLGDKITSKQRSPSQ